MLKIPPECIKCNKKWHITKGNVIRNIIIILMFINGRDAQIVKCSYRKIKDVIILHVYANISFVIYAQTNGRLIIIVDRQC